MKIGPVDSKEVSLLDVLFSLNRLLTFEVNLGPFNDTSAASYQKVPKFQFVS
jgi:hypothetical protein